MKLKNNYLSLMLSLMLVVGAVNTAYSALSIEVQADLLVNKIVKALKSKDYEEADKLFQQYDALEVKIPPPLLLRRAIVFFHLKKYLAAKRTLEKYLSEAERGSKNYNKALAMYQDVAPLAEAEVERVIEKLLAGGGFKNIPAGSFRMGDLSGDGYDYEKPVHTVRISPFEMGAYEVTVGQFRAFVEDSGYDAGNICETLEDEEWKTRSGRSWRSPGFTQSNRHPVVCVSYDDAQAFIAWLNQKTGGGYRLPTEAEWEYAARAGTKSKFFWGNSMSQADAYAWSSDNSLNRTQAVGGKKPNPWGLYDIHGNVSEWVQDWYDSDYYANSPATDPQGPSSGRYRLRRGGSWFSISKNLRSASRGGWGYLAVPRSKTIGFRLVR